MYRSFDIQAAMVRKWTALFLILIFSAIPVFGQSIIVDHNSTDITWIPESAINMAKTMLHIAYGHTSHGSQLTTGMTGLVAFANGGGLGLSHPSDIFAWNNGGTDGALDLHDTAMGGDCGYYPEWVDNTRAYLDNPSNSDVNVIVWSWCGQVDDKYAAGTLNSEYLSPMSQLEIDYPAVTFVYMTGHVDHWDDADNKAANQMVRDYCIANDKVLYDFSDIESYDPDGIYYEFPHDNCDYYASASGALLGNWATVWQNTHTENVDWYSCTSAHSEPLNANRKAYAAWWLWARLAGWDESLSVQMSSFTASVIEGEGIRLTWQTVSEVDCAGFYVWRSMMEDDAFQKISTSLLPSQGNSPVGQTYSYLDRNIVRGLTYWYQIEEISAHGTSTFYGPVCAKTEPAAPSDMTLFQNYPNPFNVETLISYYLPDKSRISLTVFNLLGIQVRSLVSDEAGSGFHSVRWNGTDDSGRSVPSGLYFIRLQSKDRTCMQKMMLLE